nr:tail fiber protein [Novosphingobium sp. B 225]
MWASSRIPEGWALCDGSMRSVQNDDVLFTVLGTTYGGDGATTFALPNLLGRLSVGAGQGVGLTPRNLGESGGDRQVALTEAELPAHSHVPMASHAPATDTVPGPSKLMGSTASNVRPYVDLTQPLGAIAAFHPNAIDPGPGQNQPHDNTMPSAALNYIICVSGLFPST